MVLLLFIFFLLMIAYGWLIDYYRKAWNEIPEYTQIAQELVKISVIVAVRNEKERIGQLLDYLTLQDYPMELLEVIVVDDHSGDNTDREVQAYMNRLPLQYMHLPKGVTSKKSAIAAGVAQATGELIVTTDADCTMELSWLRTLSAFYVNRQAVFIAAPVAMQPDKNVLEIFQALDFLTLQGITGAAVYKGFHSMCNGANLAYSKKAFEEVNGFEGIDHIPSGDDMLLMHKIYNRYPDKVFYLKNVHAIVTTTTEASWKDFFHQRIRWASKAVHYRDKRIFYALLLTYSVNVCFVVLGIACFFNPNWIFFLLLFLLAKMIIEFPFVNAVALFFRMQKYMKYFPLLQPLHILYMVVAGWLGRFGSYIWKSRRIKN